MQLLLPARRCRDQSGTRRAVGVDPLVAIRLAARRGDAGGVRGDIPVQQPDRAVSLNAAAPTAATVRTTDAAGNWTASDMIVANRAAY
jgi:hypothetical protein